MQVLVLGRIWALDIRYCKKSILKSTIIFLCYIRLCILISDWVFCPNDGLFTVVSGTGTISLLFTFLPNLCYSIQSSLFQYCCFDYVINQVTLCVNNIYDNCTLFYFEFDDGSDWTLSKGLTHANRTLFHIYMK